MKRLVPLVGLLLCLHAAAHTAIDERQIDLYYGNGIGVELSEDEAKRRWYNQLVFLFAGNTAFFKVIGKDNIKVAYNQSQGKALDFVESAIQKGLHEWHYREKMGPLNAYVLDMFLDNLFPYPLDLSTQIASYRQSIQDGHGVIVVAHSQGNLYANEAYDNLEAWMKPYFYMIGVATPANHVSGNGPAITFDNDIITYSLDNDLPTIRNPHRESDVQLQGLLDRIEFHKFDYYLGYPKNIDGNKTVSTSVGKIAIDGAIISYMDGHKYAPSQWEKSATTGCGYDKRIQVEHKFDSSLNEKMEGLSVIAFDEANKLYPIGLDYVKASAEGDSITKYGSGEVCMDLLDEKNSKVDDFRGRVTAAAAKRGAVEVTLSWENGADYDLELDMPSSVHDVQSCDMEHAYVESKFDLQFNKNQIMIL